MTVFLVVEPDGKRVHIKERYAPKFSPFVCAELTPTCFFGRERKPVTRINFSSMVVYESDHVILTPGYLISASSNEETVTIKIITPVPDAFPPIMLRPISSAEMRYIHVFNAKPNHEYLESFSFTWKDLSGIIKNLLERKNLPINYIFVGFIKEELMSLETFLEEYSEKVGTCMNLFLHSSETAILTLGQQTASTALLSPCCRTLVAYCTKALRSSNDAANARILRRLKAIASNNGIETDLLESVHWPDSSRPGFTAANFGRLEFAFAKYCSNSSFLKEVSRLFTFPLHRELGVLNYNEDTLNGSFWFPLIGYFINNIRAIDTSAVYNVFSLEWNAHQFLGIPERRIVDWALLSKSGEESFPLLLLESGKELVSEGLRHKDYTKLITLITSSCLKMAQSLYRANKDFRKARVYGMTIGELEADIYSAYPSIVQVGDSFHVHIIVCSHPHWKLNARTGPPPFTGCRSVCCNYNTRPRHVQVPFEKMVEPEHLANVTVADFEEGEIELDSEDESDCEFRQKNVALSMPKTLNNYFLQKLYVFMNHVICKSSEIANLSILPEEYRDKCKFGGNPIIPRGNTSSKTKMTPRKRKISYNPPPSSDSEPATSPIRRNQFEIVKSCPVEFEIYSKIAVFYPCFFARVYNLIDLGDGQFKYRFEKMLPLVNENNLMVEMIFDSDDLVILTRNVYTMIMDCLFGLYILHNRLGYVHSDISWRNIMYSKIDKIWKINDFDCSLPIEESLVTIRHAGTRDFIAPEAQSEEGGIITPASDIYSLGQVLLCTVVDRLLDTGFVYFTEEDDLHFIGLELERCCKLMTSESPSDRPSILKLLSILYPYYVQYLQDNSSDSQNDLVLNSIKHLLELETQSIEDAKLPAKNSSVDIKSAHLSPIQQNSIEEIENKDSLINTKRVKGEEKH